MRVSSSTLRDAVIAIPPSKSQTLRALAFGLLASGKSKIESPLISKDTKAMIDACRLLGAKVDIFPHQIVIEGGLTAAEDVIAVGNSGIALRFLGAIAALNTSYTILTGDHSIRHRRLLQPLIDGLNQLGAFAVSARGDGFAPLIVKGPLQGGQALIEGADSQPVSALLIAASFAPSKTELFVRNPGEKPWVALTLQWMDRLGLVYTHENFEKYTILGASKIDGFSYTVPGDLSSLAYPLVAALLTDSECILTNVDLSDPQGDKALIFQLQKMGALIEIDTENKRLIIKKGSQLRGDQIDVNGFIDSVPILAVIGCFAEGKTKVTGAKIARSKESDRIHAITSELKKMGALIEEHDDGFTVQRSDLKGAHVESHADHRIAMALTVAALKAKGESQLIGSESVLKSYPTFFQHLQQMGAKIE